MIFSWCWSGSFQFHFVWNPSWKNSTQVCYHTESGHKQTHWFSWLEGRVFPKNLRPLSLTLIQTIELESEEVVFTNSYWQIKWVIFYSFQSIWFSDCQCWLDINSAWGAQKNKVMMPEFPCRSIKSKSLVAEFRNQYFFKCPHMITVYSQAECPSKLLSHTHTSLRHLVLDPQYV